MSLNGKVEIKIKGENKMIQNFVLTVPSRTTLNLFIGATIKIKELKFILHHEWDDIPNKDFKIKSIDFINFKNSSHITISGTCEVLESGN